MVYSVMPKKKIIRKEWSANLDEIPGLSEELKYLMIKTGSKTHSELLSRMAYAHHNNKSIDLLWKLTLKPDKKCSKKEMIAKRFIMGLYNFGGTSNFEVTELIIEEINKVQEEYDKMLDEINANNEGQT